MTKSSKTPNRAEVRLRARTSAISDDAFAMERVWLPMCVWEGVSVRIRSARGLTMMERFVIECLLDLEGVDADDLHAIAAIPPELGDWLLFSCMQKSLAHREGDSFHADVASCKQALEQNQVPCESDEKVDILCFPETDEFVLLHDSGQLLRDLRRVLPSGQFPLHDRWKRAKRRELLAQAFDEDRIYGKGVEACIEFRDDTCLKEERAPAYHASVMLQNNGDSDWRLSVIGKRRRKHNPASDGEGVVDLVDVPMTLPVLKGARARWELACATADDSIRNALQEIGLRKVEQKTGSWQCKVDSAVAVQIGSDRLLSSSMEIEVQVDGECEFSRRLELLPADAGSREAFALDDVVRAVLAGPEGSVDLTNTSGNNITMSDVRSRLWQIREFAKVYELRKSEDFAE